MCHIFKLRVGEWDEVSVNSLWAAVVAAVVVVVVVVVAAAVVVTSMLPYVSYQCFLRRACSAYSTPIILPVTHFMQGCSLYGLCCC